MRFERYGAVKKLLNLCALVACFMCTLTEQPDLVQITCYFLKFSFFMCTDPYDALDRVLAPQTRYICASVCVMILAAFWKPQKRFIFICKIISVLSLILVVAMNKVWLAAFYWLNTEEVQKALRMDSEHTAARAWQAHGARETYTLLCKLGLDETEKIDTQKIHIFYKPVYLCGYLHGIKKAAVYEEELEKMNLIAEQYDTLSVEFEELQEKNGNLLEEIFELKRQQSHIPEKNADFWKKKYEEAEKRADEILKANEELIQGISSPDAYLEEMKKQDDLKGQTMEEKIKEARAAGMSYGEIAKYVGCSRTTAHKYANKDNG